jgi:TRAP-type mannitol/chloroaromatic compound transport system substrate-binding protein
LSKNSISNRAALFAVVTAFVVGTVGTLAIRPVHAPDAGSLASAQTQTSPARIAWRLPIVFQTTMPVLGDNPVYLTQMIKAASGGAIDLQIFEPGEIVPAFSITDAVRDGKVSAGYTWLGYDQGKIPASPLISAVPFGMEPWEYTAWWYEGNGRQLTEALYQRYNIHPILCGITGPETAGWFRRRIDSLDDVKGLKIRFAGLGGQVIERLGASVTMLPGGEIFQALEKGPLTPQNLPYPWWINP